MLAHSSYQSFVVESIIHLTDLSTLTQSINANVTSSMSRMRSIVHQLQTRKFKVIIVKVIDFWKGNYLQQNFQKDACVYFSFIENL